MAVKIFRKPGWILNPSDSQVNSILNLIERNSGKCICHNESEDSHCPCTDYRENDICHCSLYIKKYD